MDDVSGSAVRPSGCRHDNPPAHRFCDACGATLSLRCPRCQQINREGARFCAHCGAGLVTPARGAGARFADPDPDRDEDDAPERLERLLEHRARLDDARRGRLGVIATIAVAMGLVLVAVASYWVGTRSDRPHPLPLPGGQASNARTATLPPTAPEGPASPESAATAERVPTAPAESTERSMSPGLDASRERPPAPDTSASPGTEAPAASRQPRGRGAGVDAAARARGAPGAETAGRGGSGVVPAASRSVEAMAAYLVESVGGDQAEARALQNAEWYARGTSDHAYWLRVATAIRRDRAAATR